MRILSRAKRLIFSSSTAKRKASANGEKKPVVVEESGPNKSSNHVVVDSGFGYMGDFAGSKDEDFFDSRAWLESDCEDDFYSVNGEITPSGGCTPNYQISAPATPQWNKSLYLSQVTDSNSEPSPTDRKKKLSDLLKETSQGELVKNEQNAETNGMLDSFMKKNAHPPRSSEGSYHSGTNSELGSKVTPGSDFIQRKDRTEKAKTCCLPSFRPSRFNNSKKQRMSLNSESS